MRINNYVIKMIYINTYIIPIYQLKYIITVVQNNIFLNYLTSMKLINHMICVDVNECLYLRITEE